MNMVSSSAILEVQCSTICFKYKVFCKDVLLQLITLLWNFEPRHSKCSFIVLWTDTLWLQHLLEHAPVVPLAKCITSWEQPVPSLSYWIEGRRYTDRGIEITFQSSDGSVIERGHIWYDLNIKKYIRGQTTSMAVFRSVLGDVCQIFREMCYSQGSRGSLNVW